MTVSRTAIARNATSLNRLALRLRAAMSSLARAGRRWSNRHRENKMRLCETLSLGDKRFLAVVLVEQQKFLVGGAGNSVALLAELHGRTKQGRPVLDEEVHLL